MSRRLSGVMIAVLAATSLLLVATVLLTAPASADHRPGNVVMMGGTLSLTDRDAVKSARFLNARKLFVDQLNARGGLLGHRVVLKILDDKSDRRTVIELYEKLITEDKVDLVMGPYGGRMTDRAANVMERYRRPFVAHTASPTIYQRGRKYIFSDPNVPSSEREERSLHLAKGIGVERIAIIVMAGHVGWLDQFLGAQEWAKKFGLKVVLAERFPRKQRDFTALLRKIEASGAEAIITFSLFDALVTQVRQLRELNINVKMFVGGSNVALPQFIEELGGLADYVVGLSQWEPKPLLLGHPGMKAFIDSYEKLYGVTPNYHAAAGYSAMQILEAAVKEAGSFDSKKVRDAMASITVDTITGGWKANALGMGSIKGVTFQIQDGERVIVSPAHQSEARFLPMPKWEDRAKK